MKFLFLLSALLAVTFARDYPYLYIEEAQDEVVYKYTADIRTKVYDPSKFYSASYLRGDLHIREDREGNGTVFWFENVEISAYNGEDTEEYGHDEHFTKLPKESEAIYMPFYVGYDEFGLVTDVMFQKDEPEWTQNFKKAVASSVQLHVPKLTKAFSFDHSYTFYAYENTIYGKCRVAYESQKVEDVVGAYDIYKYYDPKHCDGHFEQLYTNVLPTQCHEDNDEFYRTPSTKIYRIVKNQLEHIKSKSYILMHPFKAQNNMQVVSVIQDFAFKAQVKSVKEIDFKSFVAYYPVTFTEPHVGDHIFVPDYTFGRQQFDVESYIPKIKEMFFEAIDYLGEFSAEGVAPDTKQGLVINRILKVFKYFDIKQYEEVLALLKEDKDEKDILALDFFYKILPSVGTYPSVVFIKNLIYEHKVKDTIALTMLRGLGINVHVPSEKMLKELEVFLTWQDKVKPDVYYAGILSYATIIYETYKDHEDDANVEKYIKIYYKHLIEAKTYNEQLIWLQGLSNIRIGSVYELLRPIVLGEPVFKYDRHLRVHAIWNIYLPMADHHVDAFETFWPVVVNKDLHIELRVAALKSIIRTANMSELYYIFQYMHHVDSPHLYYFFYTGIKSLAEAEIYCDRRANITAFAEQVEQYFRNSPIEMSTSVWVRDYHDDEYDMGMTVYGNTIANVKTNQVNQIYMKIDSYMANNFFNNLGIHIKFEGIESPIDSILSGLFDFDVDYFKTGRFFKRTDEPLHVEITITRHDQVIFTHYFDESDLKGFFSADYFKLMSMLKFEFLNIFYMFQGEVNVPTDIGFTAQFYSYVPNVAYFKSDVPLFTFDDKEITFQAKKFFRIWRHGTYGVNVYNPFAAMTQGVRRVYALDANLPIHYKLYVNFEDKVVKITDEKASSNIYDVTGYKTHVSTQVVSVPDKGFDLLHKTCNECNQYEIVSKGKDYRHDVEFYDFNSEWFGTNFYFGAYDCEYSVYDLHHHGNEEAPFSYDFLYEFGKVPFKKFYIHALQWFGKNAYFYPKGSCGLLWIAKSMPEAESIEYSFSFKTEVHENEETVEDVEFHHVVVPHNKHTINMLFTTNDDKENMLYQWEGEVEFTHADGQLFNELSTHWSYKTHDNDQILNWCFNRAKEYTKNEITGQHSFYYGYSHKRECVDDDFYIVVNSVATYSDEQKREIVHKDKEFTYSDCQAQLPWQKVSKVSYDCMYAHTSFRDYTYNIHFDNVPSYFEYFFKNIWHFMKVAYGAEYEYESEDFVYDKDMLIKVVYPIAYKEPIAHVTVSHKDQSYVFDDFPASNFWWFARPENYDVPMYLRWAKYLHKFQLCNIVSSKKYFSLPHHHVAEMPTKEWSLYASSHEDNHTWALYAQRPVGAEDHLAFKFVINDHWFVLKPVEEPIKPGQPQYTAVFDQQMMKYFGGNYVDEELHGLRMFTVDNMFYFSVPEYGVVGGYDGVNGFIVTLDVDHDKFKFSGKCYV